MNSHIPIRFRCWAAILHLIGAVPVVSMMLTSAVILFSLNKDAFPKISTSIIDATNYNYLNSFLTIMVVGSIVFAPFVNLLLWQVTLRIDPFVDRAGRDALSYTINAAIAMIIAVAFSGFVFLMTCFGSIPGRAMYNAGAIISAVVAIAYFLNSLAAGVFAARGNRFVSRLIYPIF